LVADQKGVVVPDPAPPAVAGLDSPLPTLASIPLTPTSLPYSTYNLSEPDPARLRRQVRAYLQTYAFCIVRLTYSGLRGDDVVAQLAEALGLGPAFLPPLYETEFGPQTPSITKLQARGRSSPGTHPVFDTSAGQGFHTDGTLQEIGQVQTSLLFCERQAAEGGDSIVFNALAACADLMTSDPAAAATLFDYRCLCRRATINQSKEVAFGPAFAFSDGTLITRYASTGAESWNFEADVNGHLRRAVNYLAACAQDGSPYVFAFWLHGGDMAILDNARTTHGRTVYKVDRARPRLFYRGLYLASVREMTGGA
jgi:alpha-ketoglutarate-dependent taurine dioxygenase